MDYLTYSQKKNTKYFSASTFLVDEQVYLTEIKYPTFPEVLAICNSTFALLMCLGYIARKFSFTLLKDQMLLIYLQNIFQGQYLSILQQNKILELNHTDQGQQDESDFQSDEQFNSIQIPTLNVKQSGKIMNSNNKVDFIIETLNQTKQKDLAQQNQSLLLKENSLIKQKATISLMNQK